MAHSTDLHDRERAVDPARCGFLLVDVQYHCAVRGHGEFAGIEGTHPDPDKEAFLQRMEATVLPNLRRLQDACRAAGAEVLFTVIESLTADGRDRSLDHKLSGIHIPRGHHDGKMPEICAPREDEIVLPKTSSGVFNSTNIDYVLRNLGVEDLIVGGVYTDQCVDMAVRDAADRGFRVTFVEDGAAGSTPAKHATAIEAFRGYCRVRTTVELLGELGG